MDGVPGMVGEAIQGTTVLSPVDTIEMDFAVVGHAALDVFGLCAGHHCAVHYWT